MSAFQVTSNKRKRAEDDVDGKEDDIIYGRFPSEIVLEILESEDTRDKNAGAMSSTEAQASPLPHRYSLKKVGSLSIDHAVKIITEHPNSVKKIEIKNVSGEKVTAIIRALYEMSVPLTALKIKNVRVSNIAVYLLKMIVVKTQELRSLKIGNIKTYIGNKHELVGFKTLNKSKDSKTVNPESFLVEKAWLEILQVTSSRSMVEFSFMLNLDYEVYKFWDFNLFIRTSKDTLKSLKLSIVGDDINVIAECNKLDKLHIQPVCQLHNDNNCVNPIKLLSMRRTLYLVVYPDVMELSLLFIDQRHNIGNVNTIIVQGNYNFRFYTKLLTTIATKYPNLHQLDIQYEEHFALYRPVWKIIKQLLTSCKTLLSISLPPMTFSDVVKIDEILSNGNYPLLLSFTTYIPPQLISDQSDDGKIIARGEEIFENFVCNKVVLNGRHYYIAEMRKRRS